MYSGIKYTFKTYVYTSLKYFMSYKHFCSKSSRPGRAGSRRISRLKGENKHLFNFGVHIKIQKRHCFWGIYSIFFSINQREAPFVSLRSQKKNGFKEPKKIQFRPSGDVLWLNVWIMYRKEKANSTWCSQAVTHPSTNQAQRCLTSLIGREAVHSTWYGRWRKYRDFNEI